MQIKQRELLELKARKLELELAATQKQLGRTPTSVVPMAHPAIVDQTKMLNPKDLAKQTAMPINTTKPVNIVSKPAFIPNQMPPTSNVRTRIAPVNSALVSSMRSRDPRLARQGTQAPPTSLTAQPTTQIPGINEHFPTKLPPSKCKH